MPASVGRSRAGRRQNPSLPARFPYVAAHTVMLGRSIGRSAYFFIKSCMRAPATSRSITSSAPSRTKATISTALLIGTGDFGQYWPSRRLALEKLEVFDESLVMRSRLFISATSGPVSTRTLCPAAAWLLNICCDFGKVNRTDKTTDQLARGCRSKTGRRVAYAIAPLAVGQNRSGSWGTSRARSSDNCVRGA